jgi:hypothetical protein
MSDKQSEHFGAYYHPLFIRGKSELCEDMKRMKIKGTGLNNTVRSHNKKASRQTMTTVEARNSHLPSIFGSVTSMEEQKIFHPTVSRVVSCEPDVPLNDRHATLSLPSLPVVDLSWALKSGNDREVPGNMMHSSYDGGSSNNNSCCFCETTNTYNVSPARRRGSSLLEGAEASFGGRRFFFTLSPY